MSLDLWRSPLNRAAFALRRALGFRRGPPTLANEPKDGLFDYLEPGERTRAEERERALRRRFELDPLREASSRLDYRDNLYLLAALEEIFAGARIEHPRERPLRLVDVGSKSFSYAFALERFLGRSGQAKSRPVELLGVELDGHVVYRDLRSRADYADAYLAQLASGAARYRVADFCDVRGTFDVVTMFFPFVTKRALVAWGLPLAVFDPERLVRHALAVGRGGLICALSQTEEERDRLVELATAAGATIERSVRIECALVAYHAATLDRWGTRIAAPR